MFNDPNNIFFLKNWTSHMSEILKKQISNCKFKIVSKYVYKKLMPEYYLKSLPLMKLKLKCRFNENEIIIVFILLHPEDESCFNFFILKLYEDSHGIISENRISGFLRSEVSNVLKEHGPVETKYRLLNDFNNPIVASVDCLKK